MRLKSVVKYNLSEMKNSILIFYGIIAAIIVLSCFLTTVMSVNVSGGGMELASAIFLFVCGLNSFKQNYLFLSTNGITRKTQFYGFFISSSTVAVLMGAIDTIYANTLYELMDNNTLFNILFEGFVKEASRPLTIIMGFVCNVVLYLSVMTLGYFITTLYYRMSKALKIIVSVGVPAWFLIILPLLIESSSKMSKWIDEITNSLKFLYNGNNPAIGALFLLALTAILGGLSFLLVRRAPVKQ